MMITHRHLEQTQALAQFRSFAKASRHLHLSQPALSRSISNLEDQLGVKLFDRKHNNVTPTLFGKYILEKGEHVLQELKLLNRDLRLLRDNQAGEISLGCGPFPAELFIGDALSCFHSAYPKLDIHVKVDTTSKLLKLLRERMLDLFIADTRMIMQEKDLEIVNFRPKQTYFCCSKKHPLAKLKKLGIKEVIEYPLATMSLPTVVVTMLQEISGIDIFNTADLPYGFIQCDNFSILLNIISSTNAIGISCEEVVDRSMYKNDIVFLPIRFAEFMTHYGAVSLKGCTHPPAIDFLHQCISEAANHS